MSRHRRLWQASVTAMVTVLGLVSHAGSAAATEAEPETTAAQLPLERLEITATQVASGLDRPTAIASPGDGSGRLLITEKPGMVRAYHPDTGLSSDPLLDITDRITTEGNEQGLLGIAVPADFAQEPELYVTYTASPDGELRLSRFPMDSAGQETISPQDEEIVLTQEHSANTNHNGGAIEFGPEGHLYWSIGDGGGSGDPLDSGQDLTTLLGTIVRLDVSRECGDRAYCVPEDNPFVSDPEARSEIWSYGLRNPWRFSIDTDGSLWIADVGQGEFEEVNHLGPEDAGANLGWPCREGPEVFDEERCRSDAEYVEPVFHYTHEGTACSVTGGHVYRGEEFADLAAGTYILADYCSADAWGLRPAADGEPYDSRLLGGLPTQPTSFGTDAEGELYMVNDLPGQLHRVSFEAAPPELDCSVDYRVTSEWGDGFTTSVTVANTGDEPIEDWGLEWTFPEGQQVTAAWQASLTQQDASVSAESLDWNGTIDAGESREFGFQGSYDGSNPAPESFELNGAVCES